LISASLSRSAIAEARERFSYREDLDDLPLDRG
jgi:hypothetical protein